MTIVIYKVSELLNDRYLPIMYNQSKKACDDYVAERSGKFPKEHYQVERIIVEDG